MADVNIDTKPISELIDNFRKQAEKNSITPEAVGYIFQRLADLLSTASSSQSAVIMQKWYENIRFADPYISKITQNTSDRNHVFLDQNVVNTTTGEKQTIIDAIQIQQATTERAGAMRAQQVTDLNNCRRSVASLETAVSDLQNSQSTLVVKLISKVDGNSYLKGKTYLQGSLCTIVAEVYLEGGFNTINVTLPYKALYTPELTIYHADSMQWLQINIFNNGTQSNLMAFIPEDFLHDDYINVTFSLTYPIA